MCLWMAVTFHAPIALTFVLALAGCVASPTVDMTAAQVALDQAQPLASHYAAPELAAAKAKLARAEQALALDEPSRARRLAEEAEVDARVAWALAENERSRHP
jgi:hypothetical protein